MKLLLVALFVTAASARPNPVPDDEDTGPVDVIINGVPEGEPLEIEHIVNIKLKKHIDGEVASATNVLFPYTAEGLALAAAEAASPEAPELLPSEVVPDPVIIPPPAAPEVIPEIEIPAPEVVFPSPPTPEVIPDPVVLPPSPEPEVVPPVVLPSPPSPEVIPDPAVLPPPPPEVVDGLPDEVALPEPEAQGPNGVIFNDGLVSVIVNTPEDSGVVATLQSWLNMVLNYFNSEGEATSHQIV